MLLIIQNDWFVDEKGRKVLLRGVNLGGSSKVPANPNGATHIKTDFTNRDVSFVARPFPLKDASTHFRRIKHWGFNSLRFVITWEAIEHRDPGQYDKEYLDYVEEVLKIAEEYRFYIIIDPHQDVWSRASGGDGAPLWTFEKIGLDLTMFDKAEAAYTMQYHYDPQDKDAYPDMSWIQNSGRLASATMWTLFFGGQDFAPSCQIGGQTAQDYLQQHYINAFKQIAIRVKDNPYVIGFETLNEPSPGWIGSLVDGSDMDVSKTLYYVFTPFDSMLTASGVPREIPYRAAKRFGIKEIRRDVLNPDRVSCWLEGFEDIWRREGVWDFNENGEPHILRNNHFKVVKGRCIDFFNDYFIAFIKRYTKGIREINPNTIIFMVAPSDVLMGEMPLAVTLPNNIVNSAHWYDEPTIGMKRFMGKASYDTRANKIVLGAENIQKMFTRQLKSIKAASMKVFGGMPTVIGEFGLCFNLEEKAAYQFWKKKPSKAWKTHIQALSKYHNALDANLLHSILWNYTADNDNTWGDQWNLEDFSIFSVDQQIEAKDINSGGRAIEGFSRPYYLSVAGTPQRMKYSQKSKTFQFEFDADPNIDASTILYVPEVQYPKGFEIKLSDGEIEETKEPQLVAIRVRKKGHHEVFIKAIK